MGRFEVVKLRLTFLNFLDLQVGRFLLLQQYITIQKKSAKTLKQKTKNNTLNLICSQQDLTCTKLKTDCIIRFNTRKLKLLF